MQYRLAQKAWEIDLSKIQEGFLYAPIVTYAENRNKAKSQLLKEVSCENVSIDGEEDQVTYLNIPVCRAKHLDLFEFNGKELTTQEIIEEKIKQKRAALLDQILSNKGIEYCYIYKRGYYKPNSCGYTDFKHRAGVFKKEEAVSSARSCEDIDIYPIDIEKHNQMIQNEISDLKTRLIDS